MALLLRQKDKDGLLNPWKSYITGMDFLSSPLYWDTGFFGYDLTFFTGVQRVKFKYLLWTEYIKYYFFCDGKYFIFQT